MDRTKARKRAKCDAQATENTNKSGSFCIPRWVVAAASVLLTAVFMLTPLGQAISDFVYGADAHKAAEDKNGKLLDGKQTFDSVEDVLDMHPGFLLMVNDEYPVKSVTTENTGDCITVTCIYTVDGDNVETTQSVYYSEFSMGGAIKVTGKAAQIIATFNSGTIAVYGGYEDGYGHAMAPDKNCIYEFRCHNTPQNTFTEFIEGCYLAESQR